ncbi:hypothetical protein J2Z83_003645 [Virgibacillus natechei]|uniref:Uncharacterized protein n=1 Tax=Virgibacillus natechei TaxID=1216297 RepID=A0ABS4IKK2_9BACI|nr:hypothetical protein [Virgibacillus natechei]
MVKYLVREIIGVEVIQWMEKECPLSTARKKGFRE